ncbi:hypothetical protein OIV19_18230 [Brucella sp. HL-2]|nr:hypothetical protein [Brucella sp. HL-2]MCV9909541.1 hypothetical protein [Brucella sp. HL-2]
MKNFIRSAGIIRSHYDKFMCGLMVALFMPVDVNAQDVDVSAPLDILKKAREKASASNLNTDSIESGLGKGANVVIIVFGLIGLLLAGISGYKLYQASQDEQSRESTGRSVAGLIIGGLLTIIAVIVGFITNTATN